MDDMRGTKGCPWLIEKINHMFVMNPLSFYAPPKREGEFA
jgi:hypothetical protein